MRPYHFERRKFSLNAIANIRLVNRDRVSELFPSISVTFAPGH